MCIQSTQLLVNALEMVTISTVENNGNHNPDDDDDDDDEWPFQSPWGKSTKLFVHICPLSAH